MDVQAIYDELAQAYGLPACIVTVGETMRHPGQRAAEAMYHNNYITVHPETLQLGDRYLRDCLLHEAAHALAHEGVGMHEELSARGPHAARFIDAARRLSARLGLALKPEMRTADWADWPSSLRPADYYADDLLRDDDPAFVKMLAAHNLTPASNAARAYKADIFRARLDELFRD